jgi:hypothetical protein
VGSIARWTSVPKWGRYSPVKPRVGRDLFAAQVPNAGDQSLTSKASLARSPGFLVGTDKPGADSNTCRSGPNR